jgi:GNAT superfamily N-acetyltransferase
MTGNKSKEGIAALKRIVAQPSDLDTVQRIVKTAINEIYPLYYPSGVVQFFLDHHARNRILDDIEAGHVFIFETDFAIVGTGTICENEIARVFVLPEYQGRGYGSSIMKQLEDIVFRTRMTVKLDSSVPAFGMYLKRGYKFCAWRKIVTPSGQVLCYHEMEKENMQAHR